MKQMIFSKNHKSIQETATKIDDLMSEIEQISDWFMDLEPDSVDINGLILARTKLSSYLTTLNTLIMSIGHEKGRSEAEYQKQYKTRKVERKNNGESMEMSRDNAMIDSNELFLVHETTKTAYFDLCRIADSYQELNQAISQRISILRVELSKNSLFT